MDRKIIAAAAVVLLTISILAINAFAAVETIGYTYDEQGRVQTVNYGNGIEDEYVYDVMGNRSSQTISSNGSAQNQAPYAPNSPSPGDGAASVQPSVLLQWAGGDPNTGNSVTYEVYLDTATNPQLYKDGISTCELNSGALKPNTTYYWKVIARDNFNATSESSVWSFTTGNQAPGTPTNPTPLDSGTIVNQNVYLAWSASDPDVMDSLEFDVYFGSSSSPPLVAQNLTSPNCDIDDLLAAGTYFWKVVARDLSGATVEGPVWSFQAVDQEPVVYTSGTIDTDTTLTKQSGPYEIEGYLTVSPGATLTIEPGTIIKMGPDAALNVYGDLIAQGTESEKIVFTSYRDDSFSGDTNGDWNGTSPDKGDWKYIKFNTAGVTSILSHVIVRYAGGMDNYAAIYSYSNLELAHISIEDSADHGLYLQDGSSTIIESLFARCDRRGVVIMSGEADISASSFEDNQDYDIYTAGDASIQGNTIKRGIYVNSASQQVTISSNTISYDNLFPMQLPADVVGAVLAENSISNTDDESALIVLGQTISKDALWPETFIYQIESSITIQGTDGDDQLTTLTLSAGAELLFGFNSYLQVGAGGGSPGALVANGSLQHPIRFGSSRKSASSDYWTGIRIYDTADDATTMLQHCIIEHVGNSTSAKTIDIQNASPSIIQCSIENSPGTGIYVLSGSPRISGSSVSDCGQYGIQVSNGAPQIDGNHLNDNGNYDLYFSNGNGAIVDNNTLHSGLYLAVGQLASLDSNTIHYNRDFPVRLNADDIGILMADNTVTDVTPECHLEVTSGTIIHDALWPATMAYHVLGNITVKGSDGTDGITSLTVVAGAELRFAINTGITVGAGSGDPGALMAEGTAADPIVFTSNQASPAAGDWSGLTFSNTADDATTRLVHCVIEYAGIGTSGRAILIQDASPTITACTIRYSQGDGIYVSNGEPLINANTISDCGRYGVYVSSGAATISGNDFAAISEYDLYLSSGSGVTVTGNSLSSGIYVYGGSLAQVSGNSLAYDNSHPLRLSADDIGPFFSDNTLTNVDGASFVEVISGTVSRDALWPATMAYHVLGNITVKGSDGTDGITTLTVAAGAELRFAINTGITVGAGSGDPGALVAEGTAADPIVLRSNQASPAAGDWSGLTFYNTADDATTRLVHCVIEYAGRNTSGRAVYIYMASPTTTSCTIRYSQGDGIYVSNGEPLISANTISDCGRYGINVSTGAATISGNTFTAISNYDLYLSGVSGVSVTDNIMSRGLYVASGLLAQLSGNSLAYDDSHPVRLNADDIGAFFNGNTITNVGADSYIDMNGGTISHDALWPASMPYHIQGNITVKGSDGADGITTLTVAPGVELRFNLYTRLYIGASSGDPGALAAEGTAENPILFTSNRAIPADGDWYGLEFQNTADDATTRLAHCVIEYAGRGTSGRAVYVNYASPTITSCTIRYSQGDGIYVYGGNPLISENTISDCGRYGVYVSSGAATISGNDFTAISNYDLYLSNASGVTVTDNSLSSGIYVSSGSLAQVSGNSLTYDNSHPLRLSPDDVDTFLNNNTLSNIDADSYMEVTYGTVSRDALWPATMPYHIQGNITVKGSDGADGITTLTVAAGAELRFKLYSNFYIGAGGGDPGALVAEGTAESPIVFTSNQATPVAGDWYGLTFYNTTDDATTRLVHCVIEYAGRGTSGRAVYANYASPVLDYCTLRYSQGFGVQVYSASPEITHCTISDTLKGIYVQSGEPVIYGNQLAGNSSYGLHNNTAATLLAQDNWWGHLSGPYHATTNPDGQGDTVSDYVDYDPWVVDSSDMDGDGIPDQWEIDYFDNVDSIDETTDYDTDGLSDSDEYTYDTDPTDTDTDDDGASDGDEVAAGTDPLDPMSN